MGENNEVFGSLRARESITIERGTIIHGDVTTSGGAVEIAAESHVRGDIACERLRLHEGAVVEGAMRARGEMTIVQERNPLETDSPDAETDGEAEQESESTLDYPESDETRTESEGDQATSDESKGSFTSPE